MVQKLNALWMVQRMIAGLLYLTAGLVIVAAILLSIQNAFSIFHAITSVGFIYGAVKLAQYPFQPVPKLA